MSFAEPLFLLGILGAALPVVIHLINRRRAVRQSFPALAFLIQSNRREARGVKARHLVLLAVRALVIGLLAFSLAKPFVYSNEGVTASERLPTAIVFVVDNSFSMAHGDWWDRAEEEFAAASSKLRPWDEVALVTTAGKQATSVARLTDDHGAIRDAFDDLKPSQSRGDLLSAVEAAADLLDRTELPNRRIVVLSDLTAGALPEGRDVAAPIEHDVEFATIRDGEKAPANFAITSVEFEQERSSGQPSWRFDVTVQSFSDADARVELRLSVDGSVVSGGLLDVPARKHATHTFRHRLDGSGVKEGFVELVDADRLPADDRFHFALRLRDTIRTLLVNGEPAGVPFNDEMFFVERALNPRGDSQSNIVPEQVTREGLANVPLEDFDVIVLGNVANVTPTTAAKLTAFVERGGGLFIAAGDQVDVTAYNQQFAALLPKPLRGLKQLTRRDDPDWALKATTFGRLRHEHPVLRVFSTMEGPGLHSVQVLSYMLLEPTPPEQSSLVAALQDGAPALLERRVGRGRVLLMTIPVDREWSDLPLRPVFVPVMRRSVQYLARRPTSVGQTRHLVGQPVELEVASMVRERLIITGPHGHREVQTPQAGVVTFVPEAAGVYQFAADEEGDATTLHGLAHAVNVDAEESDLSPIPQSRLDEWLDTKRSEDGEDRAAGRKRDNLWPGFLFAVTMFLLFETVLGVRRSVLARMWRRLTRQPEPTV